MRISLFAAAVCAICTTANASLNLQVTSPKGWGSIYETVWSFTGSDTAVTAGFVEPGSDAAWRSSPLMESVDPGGGAGYLQETDSFIGEERFGTTFDAPHLVWPGLYAEPDHDHWSEAWLINETTGEHVVVSHILTDYLDNRIGIDVAETFSWSEGDVISWEGDVWAYIFLGYVAHDVGTPHGEQLGEWVQLPSSRLPDRTQGRTGLSEETQGLAEGSLPSPYLRFGQAGNLPVPTLSGGSPEVLLAGQTPEPSAIVLAGLALIGVGLLRRHSTSALSM